MMRCGWCGQFISYTDKDAMTYIHYGNSFDLEPPDAIDICGKCWNTLSNKRKWYYMHSEYIWRHATKLFNPEKRKRLEGSLDTKLPIANRMM